MGFISPDAKQSEKHYDSDSAFQCGNYRNKNNECVSHFIKTSALEAAILQAIKAVSQYVIENEAEFISQLKTVWNENKSKSANNGQQEIDEANQIEWVRQMNACVAQAEEAIKGELIYAD